MSTRKTANAGGRDLAATSERDDDTLGLFTFLWAQVMALQAVKLVSPIMAGKWPDSPVMAAVMVIGCLTGALCYRHGAATVGLAVSSLVVLTATGAQSNHVWFQSFICVAVLCCFSEDRDRWRGQTQHAIRCLLIALYGITGFQKLNSTFQWDMAWSCCTLMLGGMLAITPLRWMIPFVDLSLGPHIAIATELGLPVILMCEKLNGVAAVIGALFHLSICQMLSPMSVYPFSVLMAPLYVFVAPDQAVGVFRAVRPYSSALLGVYVVLERFWPLFCAPDLQQMGGQLFEYPPYGCWAAGVVWASMVYLLLLGSVLVSGCGCCSWPSSLEPRATTISTWRGRMLGLALVLFGLLPYFGVRTYPALAMFSNLRLEGGRSNHYLLGDDLDFLGWQRDYVTVLDTDIPSLRLLQVDLSLRFTPRTRETLSSLGLKHEFWITPPSLAWLDKNSTSSGGLAGSVDQFRPYSVPFIELRRRIAPLASAAARDGSKASGTVTFTRTLAAPRFSLPWLWQLLGRGAGGGADFVGFPMTYDLSVGGFLELEEPLPWWQARVARFRSFDVDYSPCRH